jgi:hypothetical protein
VKYNISANGSTLETYENISIHPKAILAAQLENKIADEEATELICENLLEAYQFSSYEANIQVLSKKARQGCKIVLSIINGHRIADFAYYGEIKNQEGNDLVFGEKQNIKSIIFDQYDFLELLGKYGLKVVQIRIDGYRDIIICNKQ